ncbi:MAG: GNAT family N-acetyltransferase [Candidatus Pacebacteria bacterium]|nr:GNAT family N-acetyltransferase [Candidatus Paceibacterota bacterium]
MKINVLKAKKEDYQSFLKIFKESEVKHRLGIPWRYKKPTSETFLKKDFEKMLKDKDCKFFLAKKEKELVGYIIIYKKETPKTIILKPRKIIFINDLSVKKGQKRIGIGSLLMKKAESWAKENKINEIELNVFSFNEEAINFYEKGGYKPYTQVMRKVIK